MMVTFVSQCEKKALPRTRRVLDAFANRIGDNTWQTVITQEGLDAVKKLLRKTASKSTAVSCHWVRSRSRSQFLWVVGNKSKFNGEGLVPVNSTEKAILPVESHWHTLQAIHVLSGIAALFHDFGKANKLFQAKIDPIKVTNISEPYRHEWVSLRMFEAFVLAAGKSNVTSDQQWLERLSVIQPSDNKNLWKDEHFITDHPQETRESPFKHLTHLPVAKAVGWLILTHHKLPYPVSKEKIALAEHAHQHLAKSIDPEWNSPQCKTSKWKKSDISKVWEIKKTSPVNSLNWCQQARLMADRALKHFAGLNEFDWLSDKFTLHLSRLSLMLADHHYSSLDANEKDQDKTYEVYANTNQDTKQFKQKLDEHLIGVQKNATQFINHLPQLIDALPTLPTVKSLEIHTSNKDFKWQNTAYDLAKSLSEDSQEQGFFGVNMASTGKGKTLGNARIMYALSSTQKTCRFSIALGLRTLTLQTGSALHDRLKLDKGDIATLIGSQAVKDLYEESEPKSAEKETGSESADDLFHDDVEVAYSGNLPEGPLQPWLERQPKLNRLLCAPILVSTIDHLIPATEAHRGGKQIAPMLRLLTSDLVLDEPDDFDSSDMPALSRLVNWAGVLGSRVLLSSATLTPDEVKGLFEAYQEGRKHFNHARGKQKGSVVCAWFDENKSQSDSIENSQAFETIHSQFAAHRSEKIKQAPIYQRAKIATIASTDTQHENIIAAMGNTVLNNIYTLHDAHKESPQEDASITLSLGLIRMANINPLVAIAQYLTQQPVKEHFHLHVCVYHGQQPLISRSAMEKSLDRILERHEPNAIWQQPEIKQAIATSNAKHHIFIVLGTSVCEVGRDWDVSWAIAEPSSMRSIIQLAGRVNRHRRLPITEENLVLLNTNYQALKHPGKVAYTRPGFETDKAMLESHDLNVILEKSQYDIIRSTPRIQKRNTFDEKANLADLEHFQISKVFFNRDREKAAKKVAADWWWHQPNHHTYVMQSKSRFRTSAPCSDYYIEISESGGDPVFRRWHTNKKEAPKVEKGIFDVNEDRQELSLLKGLSLWATHDYTSLILEQAEMIGLPRACITYGAMNLRDLSAGQAWQYSDVFGVYQRL